MMRPWELSRRHPWYWLSMLVPFFPFWAARDAVRAGDLPLDEWRRSRPSLILQGVMTSLGYGLWVVIVVALV